MKPRIGGPTDEVVSVGGHRLRLSVRGRGRPLLILNGIGGRLGLLDPLRDQLPDFQTIVFDAPGIGGSPQPGMFSRRLFRLRHYADLAKEVLLHLGLTRDVSVMGISLGGGIAQELANRAPSLVHSLVLASTTSVPVVLTTPSAYMAFFDPRRNMSRAAFLRSAPALYGGPIRRRPELAARLLPHFEPICSRGRLRQQFAAFMWSSLTFAHRIRQPALILTGDDDPLIPAYNSRILHALLPDARIEIFPGEGHLFVATSPEKSADAVRRFLLSQPESS